MDPYDGGSRSVRGQIGLRGKTNLELRQLLTSFGLSNSGDRAELCERIRAHRLLEQSIPPLVASSSISPAPSPRVDISWYDARKLGVIIHWGVYSVPGYDDVASARTRKIQNGSEWYLRRLTGPTNARMTSGSMETRAYHGAHFPEMRYVDFAPHFTASKWNPREWVHFLKQCGIQYIILTAKHHDGFCLWPNGRKHRSTGLPWNSGEIGPRRDVVGEMATATREAGLVFGLYYSLMEWDYPSTLKSFDYISEIVHRDLEDLRLRYHPSIWWMDGDWTHTMADWRLGSWLDRIHAEGAITNDRLGKDHTATTGDFQNHRDRFLPSTPLPSKWENVMTIGYSWGRNYQQTLTDYKSGADLTSIFIDTLTRGGNMLINFGPDREGSPDPFEAQSLIDFGTWVAAHAAGIYDTVPGPSPRTTYSPSTQQIYQF